MSTELFDEIVSFVTSDDKICPLPIHWEKLRKLMEREVNANGIREKIPTPLILAAWGASTDAHKRECLLEQIELSEKCGFLEKVVDFIRSLSEEDWHRCPEELIHRSSAMELMSQDWDKQQEIVSRAKELYAELISLENILIYEEATFGSYMTSFDMVHDDPKIVHAAYSEILERKTKQYENFCSIIDDFEKEHWKTDITATKSTIIKLELCRLCKLHEDLGGGGMHDFCDDLFID